MTLTTAVSKLTQIAEHLVNRKKKEKGLEAVLDGIGSGSSESSGLAGPRRHSAALRALQKALVTQPEEIVKSIEGRMQEDFNLRGQVPGSAAVQLTARSWLEMRSRVQNFQTPVRLLWAIGGVLDALNQQRISEAKARCCLALAAGDQLSIDSWFMAGSGGAHVRGSTSAGELCSTQFANGPRSTLHPPGGRSLARFGGAEVGGLRHTVGEEEAPGGSTPKASWVGSRCRITGSKAESKGQGERKRKRIWRSRWHRASSVLPIDRISSSRLSESYPADCIQDLLLRPETGAVGQPQPLGPWLEPADLFSDDPSFTAEDFTLDFCPQPLPRSSSSAQTSRGTASCGRGCQGEKIKAGAIQQPPGSLASTVKVSSLWNSLHRWICESRAGALKVFFHTTFLKQGSEANIPHTSEAVWPLPHSILELCSGGRIGR